MVDKKDILKEVRQRSISLENTLYELDIADNSKKYIVTIRQTQFNNITGDPISLNFLIYKPGNRINIPVVCVNEELNDDIEKGSLFAMQMLNAIECKCRDDIPQTFSIDVRTTPKSGVIRVKDISMPPGVQPSSRVSPDATVVTIKVPAGA